jgi:hypothetical protein
MYAQIQSGVPVELNNGMIITSGDLSVPYSTLLLWTDQQRAAFNVVLIADDVVPPSKVAINSSLSLSGGTVIRHWTLIDAPPPQVPETISNRQFAEALAFQGLITQAEALAWVKGGAVPPKLQAVVDVIPDANTKFGAQMLLDGATQFNRSHPMVAQLGAGMSPPETPAQLDDIWRMAATL